MSIELGEIKKVSLRTQWTNEATEFTPWLASDENIKKLSNVIGFELEVENTEVSAGPFSADILAKDTATGTYVIIENQLGKTDHDHLGKTITYASVLDATAVVWIAGEFTEEHKKSLDWLNDHTNDNISFYGVQVELWQIDESKPALRFNLVSKPNEAVRQATRSKSGEDLSENRKFQLDFWNSFRDKLAKTKKIPSLQTPKPAYWFDVTLGKSNIHLSNTCNTWENSVSVRVYIRNQIADKMLPFLESKKDEIEASIGQPLQWNPNPETRDKIISLVHTTDFKDKQKVEDALNWLVEYTVKFREVFSKIIKQM